MSCRKQQESYWTIELTALVPYGLALIANSLWRHRLQKTRQYLNVLVNMYCVLSVNASVARAASVGYCLKWFRLKPNFAISFVLYRDCLGLYKINMRY